MSINKTVTEDALEIVPKLITVAEATTILNCSKRTLYRWLKAGRLGYYQFERLVRLNEEEVLAYAKTCQHEL
jgi:excisionase family DNA binding protein